MSIFDDLSDMMPYSVDEFTRTGEEKGDAIYAPTPVTHSPCQIVEGPVRIRDDNGDLIVCAGQIIMAPNPRVAGDSKLQLSSGIEVSVKFVKVFPDELGEAVQVVYFS